MDLKSIGGYVCSVVIGSIGIANANMFLILAGGFAGVTTGIYNCVKLYEKFAPMIRKHLKK